MFLFCSHLKRKSTRDDSGFGAGDILGYILVLCLIKNVAQLIDKHKPYQRFDSQKESGPGSHFNFEAAYFPVF